MRKCEKSFVWVRVKRRLNLTQSLPRPHSNIHTHRLHFCASYSIHFCWLQFHHLFVVRSDQLRYLWTDVIYTGNGVLDEFFIYFISVLFNNKLFTTKFRACEVYVYTRMSSASSMDVVGKRKRTMLVPALINCTFFLERLQCIGSAN